MKKQEVLNGSVQDATNDKLCQELELTTSAVDFLGKKEKILAALRGTRGK